VLILASLLGIAGVVLFTLGGSDGFSPLYVPTRSFVLAAAITSALGLAVLESVLHETGERVLARLGLTAFVLGAALIVVAEASLIDGLGYSASLARVYVALAFLAQAAFGGALLRAHVLPSWVGRTTIAWNVGWLALLLAVNPTGGPDYYPVLHYVAPLLIGVQLLRHREPAADRAAHA
jgi:hypothetical protein